jgi:hypothetical protein
VRCGFRDDNLRCLSTKFESYVRLFHDLHTHLNRTMAFTLSIDRISVMSSIGRNTELFSASEPRRPFLTIVVGKVLKNGGNSNSIGTY